MNCASDGTSSVICNMAFFSAFMASDNKILKTLFICLYNKLLDGMKADFIQKETFKDPCSKQNIACASDFKCLSRLAILNSCSGLVTDTLSVSKISSFTIRNDKDAFW